MSKTHRTLFLYWGRRGALSWLSLQIAASFSERGNTSDLISISENNELFQRFFAYRDHILPVKTFNSWLGAIIRTPFFLWKAYRLIHQLQVAGFGAIVVLMPHVWTPIVGFFARRAGLKYAVIIHDADPHPGDFTALLNPWLYGDLRYADFVFTLSAAVLQKLLKSKPPLQGITHNLFLPDINYQPATIHKRHNPLRVLFFGRILKYKGLGLLLEAADILQARGLSIHLGVIGEGRIDEPTSMQLHDLEADVINRWIEHSEIPNLLSAYDVVVAPYTEASQSGVVSAALAAGVPVIATPVGALPDQVKDGVTGLIARDATAAAVADCLERLIRADSLYEELAQNIVHQREGRSVENFIGSIYSVLDGLSPKTAPVA